VARSSELTRRRLLGGLVTVGAGSAAAGAGTMAYFSDTESSTQNQISTGTLALDFTGSSSFSFDTTLAPTETTTDAVTLVRSGSLSGSLDVDFEYAESDVSTVDPDKSAQAVAENLEVVTLTYGGTDISGQVTGAAPPTVDDLAKNEHGENETEQNDLIDLPDPGTDGTEFTIGLRLKDVGDEFQGDGIELTVTFYLNQNDAQ